MSKQKLLAMHNILMSRHCPPFSGDRNHFFEKHVKPLGYPYFAWSDRIYEVTADGKDFRDTGFVLDVNLVTDEVTILDYTARRAEEVRIARIDAGLPA